MWILLKPSIIVNMSRKSQTYYFNSEFQSKMLQIFAGISIIQGAFFAVVGFGLIANIEKAAKRTGIDSTHPLFEALKTEHTFMNLIILGGILISMIVFTWLGLRYSFDCVGAIYHLEKDIQKMTSTKKLFQVKLRKNDYFKDFETSFNEMVQAVSASEPFDVELDKSNATLGTAIEFKKSKP